MVEVPLPDSAHLFPVNTLIPHSPTSARKGWFCKIETSRSPRLLLCPRASFSTFSPLCASQGDLLYSKDFKETVFTAFLCLSLVRLFLEL